MYDRYPTMTDSRILYNEFNRYQLNEGMKNFDSNDDESNSIQISQRNILSELSDEIRTYLSQQYMILYKNNFLN